MDWLLGTTVFASFLGGVVALLAPCCVSVMLPAYFASTFRQRSRILGMTLVFAAGVGAVILPIGLGASALSGFFLGQHRLVFSVGGAAMVLAGLVMLAGWSIMLPMPSLSGGNSGRGLGGVFSLGAFSGIASACCAPVLAGVIAVSGAVSSFPAALAVGVAYVFGMVAPLCVLALVWDRRDWGSSRLLSGRAVTLRLGPVRRTVPVASVLSGGLLVAMGALTIGLALRGPAMATSGWQVRLTAWLNHTASVVRRSLDWIPGWILTALVLGSLTALVVLAVHTARRRTREPSTAAADREIQQEPELVAPAPPASTSSTRENEQ